MPRSCPAIRTDKVRGRQGAGAQKSRRRTGLRADIEWLHQTGFWTEAANNEELIREIEGVASLYLSIIKELSRPPG